MLKSVRGITFVSKTGLAPVLPAPHPSLGAYDAKVR
jgi:hypothetical protein